MKIFDSVTDFVAHYEPNKPFLYEYYARHGQHYDEYFKYHCKEPAKKMETAISKHQEKLWELLEMKEMMMTILPETKAAYERLYPVEFTKDVHLLVGLYGSNAYTYRQFDPEIAFCLERLPAEELSLRLIAAHEFGHALHHIHSCNHGMDWENVNWAYPTTWLLQEGIATYLSMKIVDAPMDHYFAFEEDREWLRFAEANRMELSRRFLDDIDEKESTWVFKEWFSINGGEVNGESRLGYFLGYEVVGRLAAELGEEQVLLLWKRPDFYDILAEQLHLLADGARA